MGQGSLLRTDTIGALTVSLRRNRRKRIQTFHVQAKETRAQKAKTAPSLT